MAHPITVGGARTRRAIVGCFGRSSKITDSYYRRVTLLRQDRAAERAYDKFISDVAEGVFAPESFRQKVHHLNLDFQETTKPRAIFHSIEIVTGRSVFREGIKMQDKPERGNRHDGERRFGTASENFQ